MSADDTTSIANCSFCRGEGLPILPVRYAIARTDSKIPAPRAPVVNGPFGEGVTDVATLPDGQDYTLRLMRAGFLYVYNEAAGTWSGYVVTEKGYLYAYVKEIEHSLLVAMDPANPTQGVSNKLKTPSSKVEFSCAANNSAHQYPGRCISIPDAANADNIYLAFSDTAWTNRVWHEHATNAVIEGTSTHRHDQMRQLSLAEWRGGQASHASSISTISQYVAEASIEKLSDSQIKDSIDETGLEFSLDPVNGIADDVDNLVSWAESKSVDDVPAVMIALDDPVGITSDIAPLISIKVKEFMAEPDRSWPLQTHALIGSFKEAINEKTVYDYISDEVKSSNLRASDRIYAMHGGGPGARMYADTDHNLNIRKKHISDAVNNIDTKDLKEKMEDDWSNYENRIRSSYDKSGKKTLKSDSWKNEVYQKQVKIFEKKQIAPLIKAHYSWIISDLIENNLTCNYDDLVIESGLSYTAVVLKCISDTQQHGLHHLKYEEWLNSSQIDNSNYVMNALCLNNKVLREEVFVSKANTSYDDRGFITLPWTNLIDTFNAAIEESPVVKNSIAAMLGAVTSPLVKSMASKKFIVSSPIHKMLGAFAGMPVDKVTIRNGNVSDLIESIRLAMVDINPEFKRINPQIFKYKMDVWTRRTGRSDVSTGAGKFNFSVTYNRFVLKAAAVELTEQDLLNLAKRSVFQKISDVENKSISDSIKSGFGHGASSALVTMITMIVGQAAYIEQSKALVTATSEGNRIYIEGKLKAIAAGIFSAAADLVNLTIVGLASLAKSASIILIKAVSTFLTYATFGLGLVSALLFSLLDIFSGYESAQKGDYVTAGLYIISAVSGIASFITVTIAISVATGFGIGAGAATTLLGLSWTGWAVIAFLVLILANIFIVIWTDDKIQTWIGRSYFGDYNKEDRFSSLNEQQLNFESINK
ncbi:T6SS effector BTH_I2691 family protein [Cobetia sp. QF-1]|uniref:T6SS effector BTH_I2691 family protein n=1 Tax=Cobetia sp. QF-1 TaxID=1969833 RepID=UPI000B542740|nr:T6SS effector BTH_I2691 family protein [Cobetia sp. QF-1]